MKPLDKERNNREKDILGRKKNKINLLGHFQTYARTSIPSTVQDLGIPFSSVQGILKKKCITCRSSQNLKRYHKERRSDFCE